MTKRAIRVSPGRDGRRGHTRVISTSPSSSTAAMSDAVGVAPTSNPFGSGARERVYRETGADRDDEGYLLDPRQAASAKQVSYLHRLAKQKGARLPANTEDGQLTKGQASSLIDQIKAMPDKRDASAPKATPKQLGYLRSLAKKAGRELPGDAGSMTKSEASRLIEEMKRAEAPTQSVTPQRSTRERVADVRARAKQGVEDGKVDRRLYNDVLIATDDGYGGYLDGIEKELREAGL